MSNEKDNLSARGRRDSIRKASLDRGDAESMGYDKETENDFEVFKKGEDVVDFRTVSWPKASVIFLKGPIFTLLDGKCCY
jgi:hypothetical protein